MVATVRQLAPTFTVASFVEGELKDVSLEQYRGQWVVLLFYPMDFTFVCPTEIIAFNDALPDFQAINTAVLGISTDSKYTHFAWATQPRKEGGLGPDLKLPLLADQNMKISREYGVLIEEDGHPLRGLFLIDPAGILRQATINDLSVGRNVNETLRLLKAFQYTDKHGEVCPVNWTEGSKTMNADPILSKEYFSSANASASSPSSPPKKRLRVD